MELIGTRLKSNVIENKQRLRIQYNQEIIFGKNIQVISSGGLGWNF